MSDVQRVPAGDVTVTEVITRNVTVKLTGREPIELRGHGAEGLRYMPVELGIVYTRRDSAPWTAKVAMLVALILKSGNLSNSVQYNIGFEVNAQYGKRTVWGGSWPYADLPDYVPGMVETHAPVCPPEDQGWPL